MKFRGKVVHHVFSPGSKSEHQAVALLTPDGPLKLRRVGGNPFADPELEKLVGHEIDCEGEVHQQQLVLRNWSAAE